MPGVLGDSGVHVFPEPHTDADSYNTGFTLRGKACRVFEAGRMIDKELGIIEQSSPGVRKVNTSLVANE